MKNVRGPKPQENAMRRNGVRLPPVDPSCQQLLDAIVQSRGGSKAHHILIALTKYASEQEAKAAGLIE